MRAAIKYLAITCIFFIWPAYGAINDAERAGQIAEKSLCLGCHKIDGKSVGPSFKLIAKRYQSNPKTIELLTQKVRNGGAGNWGVVAMPANKKNIRDDELDLVLKWILAGAPKKN